jgi:predicted O-methyltransferase YrrM
MKNTIVKIKYILYRIFKLKKFQNVFYEIIPIKSEVKFLQHVGRVGLQNSEKHKKNIESWKSAVIFQKRQDLWEHLIVNFLKNINEGKTGGIFLEFGVYQGASLNYIAKRLHNFKSYGFDSFFGLEEDWIGFNLKKGHFSTNGTLPKIEHNVTLIQGWFQETLPTFIDEINNKHINLLHMDADTYTPTKYVLTKLNKNIQRGTIIIFDEYFGYSPKWQMHEYKAFQEFCNEFNFHYKVIAYTNIQIALLIV